jgi:hypothetical protein
MADTQIRRAIERIEEDDIISIGIDQVTLEAGEGLSIVPEMCQSWAEWHYQRRGFNRVIKMFEELIFPIAPRLETSNPRDRVYAFLGLNNNPQIQIEVEYGQTGEGVFA